MEESKSSIIIFIDDEQQPIASFKSPINFELDTRKLIDGEHRLRIVSKDPQGKEGIRIVPFTVRNGPDISIEGLRENQVVDGVIPVMINAYGKGDSKVFLIEGSEVPRSIPGWVWIGHIIIAAWAIYYLVTQLFSH